MAVSRPAPWSTIAHFSRVAVLAGGDSAEREDSLQSGRNVVQALSQSGLSVTEIDLGDESLETAELDRFDLVFLSLCGPSGKDGRIQEQLDQLGIAYTGSNAAASARSFHTLDARRRFLSSRLPTPEYALVPQSVTSSAAVTLGNFVGYPLIVKPATQGFSHGISVVQSPVYFGPAIDLARQFDSCVILERAISGETWMIPVVNELALPPVRIPSPHTTPLSSSSCIGSKQNAADQFEVVSDRHRLGVTRAQQLAVNAARVLGCRGLSCVEIQIDAAGQSWVLQVDTAPDLTSQSIVSRSSTEMGWSMSRLCLEIMASVQTSHMQRDRLRAS